MALADAPATDDDGPAPRASSRAAALDQSALMHLMGYAATRASVTLKKHFHRHMGPLKLKAVEFSILALVHTNDEVNQKQLGQALDVSAPNLAVTLDRMVERGWVRRERSERDRRAQLIRLTPEGQVLIRKALKVSHQMEVEPLKVLSAAEQALLKELLHRVARS
ncbi:MarR family transcriptional regulator [Ideonella sp. 4Y16]|uniref:MarR family transcriptional regulator n=1 Tax=Ideonella alba TaxID=2824118 RepID=A0A940YG64_9BURK|nr:MarR family transcriptional regulator [Ideonella alba]MBQ0932711.1 MarR family transcriptional regulator [Ideonella alba]MBQ0946418.1 MarR family transcriptional regulator [Ideonella alba]